MTSARMGEEGFENARILRTSSGDDKSQEM